MIKLTPCASPPLNAAGIEVKALFFNQAPGDKFISVYARYNDGQSWVPLHIGLPSVPSLQQVRDMDRNIYVNSGSFEDAHMYLRSADGNNMTVAFYANADGGAIQAGNANGFSSLNLQPEGGLLNYGGYEVATKNWTLGQGFLNAETDPTVPSWVKAITNAQILSWNGKQDALGFTPESVANKSTTTALGNSNILYPSQRAVKVYVDNQVTTINTNFIPNTQKGVANGVASLGADGKIPNAQIPALAITDTFVVTTEAAMLALTAEVGDVAVRSDVNKTFILKTAPATTLANWVELKSPTVASTDQLAEGSTNLYFTTARARNALSASAPLSYTSSTGVFSIAKADNVTNGYLSAADWVIFNAKEPAFAKNTGFNKNFGTASGTVAQGNDSRIVNGQTAFSWGDHAGLYSLLGHVHSGADITSGTISIARLPTGTTGTTVALGNHSHVGVYEPVFTLLPISKGGTGLSAIGTAQQLLRVNAGATALEYFTAPWLTGNQSITVTATGAVTGSASGTTSISLPLTIAAGVITNANINAAAAIAQTKMAALTSNRVMLTDASGFATASSVTNATLNFLDATSSIQTQLNSKVSLTSLSAVAPLSYNNTTGAFSVSQASASVNGYMSAADKAKLDGIAAGANNYTHPNSGVTAGTYNNVTVNAQGHVTSGSNTGYLTSVGVTLPTGLQASNNPLTSNGNIGITFQSGYSIPTNANQANWSAAYGWGNHASAGYLTGIPAFSQTLQANNQLESASYNNSINFNPHYNSAGGNANLIVFNTQNGFTDNYKNGGILWTRIHGGGGIAGWNSASYTGGLENVAIEAVSDDDNATGLGLGLLISTQEFFWNGHGLANMQPRLKVKARGEVQIYTLAGSGTRMVVADSNGIMSTQPIPDSNTFIRNQNSSAQSANSWINGSQRANDFIMHYDASRIAALPTDDSIGFFSYSGAAWGVKAGKLVVGSSYSVSAPANGIQAEGEIRSQGYVTAGTAGSTGTARLTSGSTAQSGHLELFKANGQRNGYIGYVNDAMHYESEIGSHIFQANSGLVMHIKPTVGIADPTLLVGNYAIAGAYTIQLVNSLGTFQTFIAGGAGQFVADTAPGDSGMRIGNSSSFHVSSGGSSWIKVNASRFQSNVPIVMGYAASAPNSGSFQLLVKDWSTSEIRTIDSAWLGSQWLQNAYPGPYAYPEMDTKGVHTGGGFATGSTRYVSSAGYTVQSGDYFIVCTGMCTVNLPDPSAWEGRILELKAAYISGSNVKSEVILNGAVYDANLQVTHVISNTTGQRLKIQAAYSTILGNYIWEVMDLNNLNH